MRESEVTLGCGRQRVAQHRVEVELARCSRSPLGSASITPSAPQAHPRTRLASSIYNLCRADAYTCHSSSCSVRLLVGPSAPSPRHLDACAIWQRAWQLCHAGRRVRLSDRAFVPCRCARSVTVHALLQGRKRSANTLTAWCSMVVGEAGGTPFAGTSASLLDVAGSSGLN